MATLGGRAEALPDLRFSNPPSRYPGAISTEEIPTVADVALAAFRTENTLGSLLAKSEDVFPEGPAVPFEITYDMVRGTPFESDLTKLDGIRSVDAFQKRLAYLQQQQSDREILASQGGIGIALTMGAAVLDPINLLPFGTGARATGFLRSMRNVTAAAVTGAGAQELALYASQDYRTGTEVALGLASSAVLGAAIGAIGGYVGHRARTRTERAIRNIVDPEDGVVVRTEGRNFAGNAEVEAELQRLARSGQPMTDLDVHAVYKRLGTELDNASATGRILDDGSIFLPSEEGSFVPRLDEEVALADRNASLDASRTESVEDALDTSERITARYAEEGC